MRIFFNVITLFNFIYFLAIVAFIVYTNVSSQRKKKARSEVSLSQYNEEDIQGLYLCESLTILVDKSLRNNEKIFNFMFYNSISKVYLTVNPNTLKILLKQHGIDEIKFFTNDTNTQGLILVEDVFIVQLKNNEMIWVEDDS